MAFLGLKHVENIAVIIKSGTDQRTAKTTAAVDCRRHAIDMQTAMRGIETAYDFSEGLIRQHDGVEP